MPDEIHIERMRQALRVMREVVAQNKPFDMSDWICRNECGTVACASGYMQMDPWHRAQGLGTKSYKFDGSGRCPSYGGKESYPALREYFGFGPQERYKINSIFSPDEYMSLPSATQVTERMEKYFNPYIEGVPA
ncbi:hypothetical protein [Acidiphilium angustum]|uniref:hypothetical protein n=1 Tax=Acidiphilium angustum TaxID=523 RepID=UPI0012DEA52D|nr:hypothetical protein [Acidiphilium angustum]